MAVHDFMSRIKHGYRPHAFNIAIDGITDKLGVMCRSATLPGDETGIIEVPYDGVIAKLPGDISYNEWTTTIMLDIDFAIYDDVENWRNQIFNHTLGIGADSAVTALKTGNIMLYDNPITKKIIREYKLMFLWPYSIGDLDLNRDSRDEIATFDVTWAYTLKVKD